MKTKKPSATKKIFGIAREFGSKQAKQDAAAREAKVPLAAAEVVTLASVQPRKLNTRDLRPPHVLTLAESIAVAGLCSPIALDAHRRLVAGLHRLNACRLLCAPDRLAFWKTIAGEPSPVDLQRIESLPAVDALQEPLRHAMIPAGVFIGLDAEADPAAALAAESAENVARRQYSPDEVRGIVDRLRLAGYREPKAGRPRPGEKPLRPALALVLGISERHASKLSNKSGTKSRLTVRPRPVDTFLAALETYAKRAAISPETVAKVRALLGIK